MPKAIDDKKIAKIKLLGSRGTLAQAEIAERVGVSQVTVGRVLRKAEQGETPPPKAKKQSSKELDVSDLGTRKGLSLTVDGGDLVIRVNIKRAKVARQILNGLI